MVSMAFCPIVLMLLIVPVFGVVSDSNTEYLVGTGIWDVTGPAAEINMVCHFILCEYHGIFVSVHISDHESHSLVDTPL